MTEGSVQAFFTVYVELAEKEIIRIIGARKATRLERSKYEEGDF